MINKKKGFTPLEVRAHLQKHKKNKLLTGFALIELLVTIGIIAILSSVLVISFKPAILKAKRARAVQSFQQIALAMHLYYDKYGDWPNYDGAEPYDGYYYWAEAEPGYDADDRPGGENGFKFYPTWDATWYCSDCKYYFKIENRGGDEKPDCGMIYILGTGTGNFIYSWSLCITSECGSTCGLTNF